MKQFELGYFYVKDKLRVADPCYKPKLFSPASLIIKNTMPGKWVGSTEVGDEGCNYLLCMHEDYNSRSRWNQIGYVSVDSGLVGIWNPEYKTYLTKEYAKICKGMHEYMDKWQALSFKQFDAIVAGDLAKATLISDLMKDHNINDPFGKVFISGVCASTSDWDYNVYTSLGYNTSTGKDQVVAIKVEFN